MPPPHPNCGDALVFLYSRIWPSKGAPPPTETY
jgi:hypothetical protein